MKFKRKKKIHPPPDITPLIDVVFLLLIFFMISTSFADKPGIKIDLPKANADIIKKENNEVRVYIAKDGNIVVDGRKVGISQLDKIFSDAADLGNQTTVIIKADKYAAHGRVVEVMDNAKEAGITKLAIATEQRKK